MTDLSIGYRNRNMMGQQIAPLIRRDQQSGLFFKWTKDFWFRRVPNAMRAPEGAYTRVGYGVENDTYFTPEKGFEKPTGRVIVNASQTPESLPQQDIRFITALMELEIEKSIEETVWSAASVWDNEPDLSGGTQWSETTSTPIVNAQTAIRTVRRNTGEKPDTLALGSEAWDDLKEHADLTEKYKYTQPRGGVLSEDLVAQAMGVDRIIVGESVENTAEEGQTFVGADIWDDRALFFVHQPAPALMTPAAAYTMVWDEVGAFPWAVEQYYDQKIRSDVSRIFCHFVPKVTSAASGYRYDDVSD